VKLAWLARGVHRQVSLHRRVVLGGAAAFCMLALLLGGARLGLLTATRWGAFIGQNVHVIVYLAEDVDPDRANGLAELLRRMPTVAHITSVEPTQALARLEKSAAALGAEALALADLEASYFPRSLEIGLRPASDLSQQASDLAKHLRGVPGVVQVDAMSEGLTRLSVWVRLGRRLGVAVLLTFGALTLGMLLELLLHSRSATRQRAAVLTQLGETTSGIRLPAMLWMAATALTGGGVGALFLTLGWRPLIGRLETSLGIASASPLPRLGLREIAAGLAFTLVVGLALGFFATPLPRPDDHA
jgi:cell division protein FtsX